MKTVVFQLGQGCRSWLVAALLCWAGVAQGATFSVSPTNVSYTYTGQITLQIGGVTGATVVVDKYLDANTTSLTRRTRTGWCKASG